MDPQGRVPLPNKWRPEGGQKLEMMAVMMKHPSGSHYVTVLTMDLFDRFCEPICAGGFQDSKAMNDRHSYVERIIELELDGSDRLQLPKEIRAEAGLSGNVVFLGLIDRFEIWNPKNYGEARDKEKSFAEMNMSGK
jgi:DNA-binding transcriptional regulator/RsmH inhibitor MraZ